MNIWNLLPVGFVSRAKAVVAFIGGAAYVVVSYVPSVASVHWVSIVIAVLTVLGVYTVPNSNVRSLHAAILRAMKASADIVAPSGSE